ncbi:MAG: histidinol dehydrogenase, partial [Planctomycetota bacterium]
MRKDGWPAAIRHAERLGDIKPGAPAIVPAESLAAAVEAVGSETAALLRRTADQIRVFAEAQRQTTTETTIEVPGGTMGQSVAPVARAGCYAPGGRFPLP